MPMTSRIRRTATGLVAVVAAAFILPHGALAQQEEQGQEEPEYQEARYAADSGMSLLAILKENAEFSAFVNLLEAADLDRLLEEEGPYTVFVPTNEAFQGIDEPALKGQARANERIRDIVLGHIVEGKISSAQLAEKNHVSPLHRDVPGAIEPRAHTVDIVEGRIVLGGRGQVDADVVEVDIDGANGVIHVINAVILEQRKGPQK